ncbi:MAG: MFS transporter [Acidimicrobiaceae bacterium]|nr:MFS transporter [Acidimicrobiaceae bacterium]
MSGFGRLAIVHGCSSAADTLVVVALAGSLFVSVPLHAARGRTALGLACTVLPFIVVGPLIGPLIDRLRGGRRFMVWMSALGRAAACVLMAVAIHSLWLFPAAFLSLVCSRAYLVAKASLVPSLVDRKEQLVEANSKLAIGSCLATAVAGLAGGGAYRVFGSTALLQANVVLCLVCGWQALRLPPVDRSDVRVAPAGPQVGRARREFPPGALPVTTGLMASVRGMAGLMTTLVAFGFRYDHTPLAWYGIVGAAGMGGTLIGPAVSPALRRRLPEHHIMVLSALVIGGMAVAAAQASLGHVRMAATLLSFTVAFGGSVAKAACDAIVQRDAAPGSCGRVVGYYEGLCQLGWVLAALVPIVVPMSLVNGFLLMAAVTFASIVVFVVGVARRRRRPPAAWAVEPAV